MGASQSTAGQRCARLFPCCDRNKDGIVTWDEFVWSIQQALGVISKITTKTQEFLQKLNLRDDENFQKALGFLNEANKVFEQVSNTTSSNKKFKLESKLEVPDHFQNITDLDGDGDVDIKDVEILLKNAETICQGLINKGVQVQEAKKHLETIKDIITQAQNQASVLPAAAP